MVYKAIWEEDFEDGSLGDFTTYISGCDVTNYRARGTYSIGDPSPGTESEGIDVFSVTPPPLSGGDTPNKVEFYWNEDSGSYGGALMFINSNGNYELGIASNNPQWDIYDGSWTQAYGGDGYDRWIYNEVTFDWSAGTADIYIEDLSSGSTWSGTKNLVNNVDLEQLLEKTYTAGSFETGHWNMWYDDFAVLEETISLTGTITVDGTTYSGAHVWAWNLDRGQFIGHTTTDSSGNYSLDVIGGNHIAVAVQYDDGSTYYGDVKSIQT